MAQILIIKLVPRANVWENAIIEFLIVGSIGAHMYMYMLVP